jgi:hypothetical protein
VIRLGGVEEVALIVLGAIVGALSTGGVAAWESWREREVRRRVAARLILGDLYVIEAASKMIIKSQRWPDRFDLDPALDTWRESRPALAAGVKPWDWTVVAACYSFTERTAPMVRLGKSATQNDLDVLAELQAWTADAQRIVAAHVAPKRQQAKAVRELRAHLAK